MFQSTPRFNRITTLWLELIFVCFVLARQSISTPKPFPIPQRIFLRYLDWFILICIFLVCLPSLRWIWWVSSRCAPRRALTAPCRPVNGNWSTLTRRVGRLVFMWWYYLIRLEFGTCFVPVLVDFWEFFQIFGARNWSGKWRCKMAANRIEMRFFSSFQKWFYATWYLQI